MKTLQRTEPTEETNALVAGIISLINGHDGRAAVSALMTLSVRGIVMIRHQADDADLRDWIRSSGDLLHVLADCPREELVTIAQNATFRASAQGDGDPGEVDARE